MKQFSLRHLLTEVALLAGFLGLARFVVTNTPFEYPLDHLLALALAGLVGAFIGGLFHHYWLGALIGAVTWLVMGIIMIQFIRV